MSPRLTKKQREYREKLRDPRWQRKKNGVLDRDGYECMWCRAGLEHGRNLQVHHGFYRWGLEPWEYPSSSLYTLCEHCHEQAESLKQELREAQGMVPPWLQHHVYEFMQRLLERVSGGEELPVLAPWKPVDEEAA